ncbi:hypothetical protein EV213_105206 [Aureibacillus halotolerans]|uniref:N-acetyltransferase domain-containing protein n=1 Tax=Aureibacillus halotolerans TaxID=1508390 RepID=A0A4R6U398_9BACI|nr:hypothetical protein EV213_105206 [Aureibacillus halotolerans]
MNVISYKSSAVFLTENREVLENREAENSLLLGLAQLAVDQEKTGQEPLALGSWRVENEAGESVLLLFLSTKNLIIACGTSTPSKGALESAVAQLLNSDLPVSGMVGPRPLTDELAALWETRTSHQKTIAMNQRIYELRKVKRLPGMGRLIQAEPSMLPMAADWTFAFGSVTEGITRDEAEKLVQQGYDRKQLYFWELEGRIVSMAKAARPTTHSMTIGLVYTPPEHRNNGYASSCVAALSQQVLNQGFHYCVLYTDLSNPTSNHIYQDMGYVPVCDSVHYRFS